MDIQDKVIKQVIDKLASRSKAGIIKYGTTLEKNQLTHLEWLNHAQEEALDLAGYLQKLINAIEDDVQNA
jgi:hypothetical protein